MELSINPFDEAVVRAETHRIYTASAWVSPVGSAVFLVVIGLLLWEAVPRPALLAWLGLQVVVVAALTVGCFSRSPATSGLPPMVRFAHRLNGVAFGLLLWIDPAMVADAELRWLGIAMMFALSAGVQGGLSGAPALGLGVVIPMWGLGSLALLAGGRWVEAGGGLFYLVIQLVDQKRTAELWRELITLRIREERRADEHTWLAHHDAMTGLLNRSGILAHLLTHPSSSTTMFIDLDRFKAVNDEYGHQAGDEVLVEVARRLQSLVRSSDAVSRLGGDEFFIVFDRVLTEVEAAGLGDRIIALIEQPVETSAGWASVSASVGATISREGLAQSDPADLIAEADSALLQAKRNGRHQVVVASR